METHSNAIMSNVTLYLQLLFLNLFLIVGIWTIFQPGMIFGRAGDYLTDRLPEYVTHPVMNCPKCMASIWGTAFFFGAKLDQLMPWYFFPLHSLALCGLATLAMMIDGTSK